MESTKSVSDIYCPADGEVTEVNPEVDEDPGLVNSDPYGAGWMVRVRPEPGGPALLSAEEYRALVEAS